MKINNNILNLANYAVKKNLIKKDDYNYCINKLLNILQIDDYEFNIIEVENNEEISSLLKPILDFAFETGLFEPNSIVQRDLYESMIMDIFTERPSSLNKTFYDLYNTSPVKATDFYYDMSKNNNYIKTSRTSKNILWNSNTKYGDLHLTINLSKPEKDPRDIIAQKASNVIDYPKCLLCKENVGFYGNNSKPGRTNHRIIKLDLNSEEFYLQYSPYSYYDEHLIVLKSDHTPMNISINTFKRLFDFVEQFPHYFLGSNAGLPIVGGSILSHEHYQGGKYHFPIYDASVLNEYIVKDIVLKQLYWPLSVVRLESSNKDSIIKLADKFFKFWENYNDADAGIISYTNDFHNAITPIARKEGNNYILDMTLRNNLTSDELPMGIFHPHPSNHHIKKENIGLIEVMGLAILPARLVEELEEVKKAIKKNTNLLTEFNIHSDWVNELKEKYSGEDIDLFINNEVANKFMLCIEDSGVFKQTESGQKQFDIFMEKLINVLS